MSETIKPMNVADLVEGGGLVRPLDGRAGIINLADPAPGFASFADIFPDGKPIDIMVDYPPPAKSIVINGKIESVDWDALARATLMSMPEPAMPNCTITFTGDSAALRELETIREATRVRPSKETIALMREDLEAMQAMADTRPEKRRAQGWAVLLEMHDRLVALDAPPAAKG